MIFLSTNDRKINTPSKRLIDFFVANQTGIYQSLKFTKDRFTMTFPILPKRKADSISNGVFLVLLGILFYTGHWWPDILFALGLTFAIRQYLTGRRLNFFITIVLVGLLGVVTLIGQAYSLAVPLLLMAAGIFLIAKECLTFKGPSHWNSSANSQDNKKPKEPTP